MRLNFNLYPRGGSLLKKIIIIIIFMILCFFIKNYSVSAKQMPSILTPFTEFNVLPTGHCADTTDDDYLLCHYRLDSEGGFDSGYRFGYVNNMVDNYNNWIILKSPDATNNPNSSGNLTYQIFYFRFSPRVVCEGHICYFRDTASPNSVVNQSFNVYTLHISTDNTYRYLSEDISNSIRKIDLFPSLYDSSVVSMNGGPMVVLTNFNLVDDNNNILLSANSTNTDDWGYTMDEYYSEYNENNLSFIDKIVLGIGNAFGRVLSPVVDFIHDLFIPPETFYEDFLLDEYDFLSEKLGILFYPITLLTDFATRVYNMSNSTSAIFTIPNVDFMGTRIVSTNSVDLIILVNSSQPLTYMYNIYRIVVSGFIVLWLVNLGRREFNNTFGGGHN